MFELSAPRDSVCTARELWFIRQPRRWPHDLQPKSANHRHSGGRVACAHQPAWLGQAGAYPKLVETFPAIESSRLYSAHFSLDLVVLVACDNGNGRVLQFSPATANCPPDWFRPRPALR